MRNIVALSIVAVLGALAWQIGGKLSPDALGMAVGLLFGVLASVPAALLVLAAGRRADGYAQEHPAGYRRHPARALPKPAQPEPPIYIVSEEDARRLLGGKSVATTFDRGIVSGREEYFLSDRGLDW